MSIVSEEMVGVPSAYNLVEVPSIYEYEIGTPIVTYLQSVDISSINTPRDDDNFVGIILGNTHRIIIPDINAIEDFRSNYVGIGLKILEVIALAGQYIGAYIVPPTLRPSEQGIPDSGAALQDGDMIYDRYYKVIRVWTSDNSNWEEMPFSSQSDYFRVGLIPTRVDDISFTFPVDFTNIYASASRIRFADANNTEVNYGTVTSSIWNGTINTITVSMDTGVVPSPLKYADLSAIPNNGWTEVNSPAGTSTISIGATGMIGLVSWFLLSDGNKLITSNDGVVWSDISTDPAVYGNGSESLADGDIIQQIEYHPYYQTFWVSTTNGKIMWTNDFVTWDNDPYLYASGSFTSSGGILADKLGTTIYLEANTYWFSSIDNGANWVRSSLDPDRTSDYIISNRYNDYYYQFIQQPTSSICKVSASIDNFGSLDEVIPERFNNAVDMAVNGYLVVCDNGIIEKATSSTTNTLNATSSSFGTSDIKGVCFNDTTTLLVASGQHGKIATSTDLGSNWVQRGTPFSMTETIHLVLVNESINLYVAAGDNGKICVSNNGVN